MQQHMFLHRRNLAARLRVLELNDNAHFCNQNMSCPAQIQRAIYPSYFASYPVEIMCGYGVRIGHTFVITSQSAPGIFRDGKGTRGEQGEVSMACEKERTTRRKTFEDRKIA